MEEEDLTGSITIEISDTQGFVAVEPRALVALGQRVLAREGVSAASISVAVVDNFTIAALNEQFLSHEGPTDVISFSLSEPDERTLAGELVISGEMAAQVAGAHGAAPEEELALYVVHGLLHLCGYDDQSPAGASLMRQREAEHLAGWRNEREAAAPAEPKGEERLNWPV